jgi:TIR domain/SIR2-like domain
MLGPEVPASPSAAGNAPDAAVVEALKHQLADELEADRRVVCGTTLAAIAQQYEDAYGSKSLKSTAEDFYRKSQYVPSPVHQMLASLPFSLVVTTSQDQLFAQALKATNMSKTASVQRYHAWGDKRDNPEFEITGSPSAPVIYHLFGHADEPESLVLSENDVLDFLKAVISGSSPMPNSLLRILKSKEQSFLFLGFGVRRWDLRMLLKILLKTWEQDQGSIAAESLAGLADSDCEEMALFYQRGTRIEIEDTDAATFLAQVSQKLQAAGGYAGKNTAPIARPRVFISYAREDSDLASRLYNALTQQQCDPWLDTQRLTPGIQWNPQIESELQAADFVVVLYTDMLSHKTDNYVNKEIALALDRAKYIQQGHPFLIPLRTCDIKDENRVQALNPFEETLTRSASFDDDISNLASLMKREYQLRKRG